MGKVVVIGSANADLIVEVARRPDGGETIAGSELATASGGKGANQATALGLLGADVAFLGCVGRDGHGELLRASLAGAGVDVSGLAGVGRATSVALIVVTPDGENSIIVTDGANREVTAAFLAEHEAAWRDADVVVMQLEVPAEAVAFMAAECGRRGIRFVLNLAPAAAVPDEVLHACDPLVLNESEAALLLGRSATDDVVDALLALGPRSVVVTLGAQGAVAGEGASRLSQPAERVEVVDTTGAGDAFVGGLVRELADGGSLAAGLRLGVRAAAVAVRGRGAASSYGPMRELR